MMLRRRWTELRLKKNCGSLNMTRREGRLKMLKAVLTKRLSNLTGAVMGSKSS
jgi:hypothetical protein